MEQAPQPSSAVRRFEAARSVVELTATTLAAIVQIVTIAAVAQRTFRSVGRKSTGTS